ncbi:hypothetical protein NIES4071_03440 [Calothrix sp. NIES-4071]|nr:hypothetical protein NIES4071_03440 [Calothrix sp. NIES-4071]BAZ54690.1 hypothetical protein NIES4105_03430 [Calothrix sp. NIES-4105]
MDYINELEMNSRTSLWLDILDEERLKAWNNSQNQSNTIACYNSYLNQVCLYSFINWLTDWFAESSNVTPTIYSNLDTPSVWEVLSGAAIAVGKKRIILIPTETNDLEELSVPQEWVDIPSFVGDYYLAIQVNLGADTSERWMRVCGFATHRQLKNFGKYDSFERAYILPVKDLTASINVMLLTLELNVREEVSELSSLEASEAQKLLGLLSNTSIYSPRLHRDVTFEQWAKLLDNQEWRQFLHQSRMNSLVSTDTNTNISLTNLHNWFEKIYDTGWQSLQTLMSSKQLNFAFRQRELVTREVSVEGVKVIDLGMQLGNQSVALLLGLTVEDERKVGIKVQLHPAGGETYLPEDIKLKLISQSGTTVQELQSRIQDNCLQLKRFTCIRGKSFKIEVSINNFSITEDFVIEASAPAIYE